jgi:uncharacterized phiE125 gp8 family phage protein
MTHIFTTREYKPLPAILQTAAPASEPLSLSEAKDFLRVEGTADDTFIGELITVAREAAEVYLRASLITQSWMLVYDDYAPSKTPLPFGPVQSITSVTLVARDETTTLLDSSSYYLTAGNRHVMFDATPVSHQVEIVYVAGFGAASDVPSPIKQGMLHHIATMYDDRAGERVIPRASEVLYGGYRGVEI